jgi:hypothetical protein
MKSWRLQLSRRGSTILVKKLQIFTHAFYIIILNHLYPSSNFSIRGVEAGRGGKDAGGSGKASPQDIRDLRRGESGWSPFQSKPCFHLIFSVFINQFFMLME